MGAGTEESTGPLPGLSWGHILEMVGLSGPQWSGNNLAAQGQTTGPPDYLGPSFQGPEFQTLPQSPREERQHTI